MDKSTEIFEMQKIHLGSKFFGADGDDGTLTHVGFDPATRRLTHIGVKPRFFLSKVVFLPFSVVVATNSNGVTLSIQRAELAAASTVAPSGALLDTRSSVLNSATSTRGGLKLVAVQPESGELAYVVAHNLQSNRDTLLRNDVITKLDAGQVTVSLSEPSLQTLPPYRSDAEVQREVEDILFDLTALHVDLPGMIIRVRDAVLYLDGNVSSSLRCDIVQDQVGGVQGLVDVKNNLVGDDWLAANLAMALGRDPYTRDLPIGVYPRLGVVRLSGAVHNSQQAAEAVDVASTFSGVRSVINDLVIDPKTDLLHVMSSSAGGETGDKIPGEYVRHTK